jgi:hypothetical protein
MICLLLLIGAGLFKCNGVDEDDVDGCINDDPLEAGIDFIDKCDVFNFRFCSNFST